MDTFRTFSPGGTRALGRGNQDTTMQGKLFQSEVEYLGHRITKGGVSMTPEHVQKIKVWPVPKSGKEVATFLGFAG